MVFVFIYLFGATSGLAVILNVFLIFPRLFSPVVLVQSQTLAITHNRKETSRMV